MMKIRNSDKKTRNFSAILFFTLIIASTIGGSFAISNSFAQQQQLQQAPTITYKSPWNNNMPISSVGSNQPLCQGGICPASTASAQPTAQPQNTGSSLSTSTNSAQPTKVSTSLKNTFTNSK